MSKIDFPNRKIYGDSGKIYTISPETLSAGRAAEFQIRGATLGFNVSFETLLMTIDNCTKILKEGNNFGAIAEVITNLSKIKEGMINFQLNSRPAIVEFCSLFCIGEGEDVGTHTEDVIREKYNDWRKIPFDDFFLLSANVIPSFRERYLKIINQVKSEER